MENNYVLMADSNCEILLEWQDKYDIKVLYMPYAIDGTEYDYDLGRNIDVKAFYDQMRSGTTASTMQRNAEEFKEFWKADLDAGKDILYICFSSNLSATYQSALMAREEILKNYPERRIYIVDTLSISGGLAVFVHECAKLKDSGMAIEELYDWAEKNKQCFNAIFSVSDLAYLKRGGRLTGAAAFFGTLLEVKPMLCISPEGKLIPKEKVKGRKKALKRLCELAINHIGDDASQAHLHIIHADCEDEAENIKKKLNEKYPDAEISMKMIGPVIGSHAGPGTIGVCYKAKDRNIFSEN